MKRSRNRLLYGLFAALCGILAIPHGSPGETGTTGSATGRARLSLSVGKVRSKQVFTVPVTIDLTSVRVGGQPAALGAYLVRLDFDPAAVTYVGVTGAPKGLFGKEPVSTDAARANAGGKVKLTGATTELSGTGQVQVALARFKEKRAGGAKTISVHLESLASAGTAPASIPFAE